MVRYNILLQFFYMYVHNLGIICLQQIFSSNFIASLGMRRNIDCKTRLYALCSSRARCIVLRAMQAKRIDDDGRLKVRHILEVETNP